VHALAGYPRQRGQVAVTSGTDDDRWAHWPSTGIV
jgi:hypothetical protein